MNNELFSVGAIYSMNKKFPNIEKLSQFESFDLASDLVMGSMSIEHINEYVFRFGSKLMSAKVNEKPCIIRYIDVTQNVETQAETFAYLSLLKTLRHVHLEEVSTVGLIEFGTGKNRDTKVKLLKLSIYIISH